VNSLAKTVTRQLITNQKFLLTDAAVACCEHSAPRRHLVGGVNV